MRPRTRASAAQALVEFALVLPLLVVLSLGLVQVVLYAHARDVLLSSVQEGARLAAEDGRLLDDGYARAETLLSAGLGTSLDALQLAASLDEDVVAVRADAWLRPKFLWFRSVNEALNPSGDSLGCCPILDTTASQNTESGNGGFAVGTLARAITIVTLLGLAGCSAPSPRYSAGYAPHHRTHEVARSSAPAREHAADPGGGSRGLASFYSGRAATGERVGANVLTAAHRTLPFGSKVKVTNKSNGRSVIVTINDRGPFVRGRVIDVTPAAARLLGFSGLAQVAINAGQ